MPKRQSLSSRRYGGEVARSRVEYLLGLEDAPEEWRVRFVAWYDDHLLVVLGRKGALGLVLAVAEVTPEQPYWVCAGHFAIIHKGSGRVPEPVARRVQERAPIRMASLGVEDLVRIFDEDPDAKPLPEVQTKEKQGLSDLLTCWAGQDAYADFFAVGEMPREQLNSLDLTGSFRLVQHCEMECMMATPHAVTGLMSTVEYPWDHRVRLLDLGAEAPEVKPDLDEMATTELSEKDIIFGNPRRLREVLDHVVSMPNPAEKIILFSNTCLPAVTGEDVESVVRQYARKSKVPIVYLTVTPKSMFNVMRGLFYTRRREAEENSPPPDPRSVNLVGFPDGVVSKELRELLAEAGIRVNTHLIPEVSVERIEKLPHAALSVLYPNSLWTNHYAHLMEDTKIRYIMPPAPYGFEGTRQWFLAIGEALGIRSDAQVAFEKAFRRNQEAWEDARSQALGHRVALVVRADESFHLSDPSTTWGVHLLKFFEEAGFEVEILVYASEKSKLQKVSKVAASEVKDPTRLVIRGFNSFETMRKALRESQAQAVLSYYTFDWRVHEAGKNRFSLQVFETGLLGAVRTVQRLVGICRTPFYMRYHDYLKRRMDGIPEVLKPGGQDGAP
jgi:nitrogenase molybdenum-iron protein alpha/beta subunit